MGLLGTGNKGVTLWGTVGSEADEWLKLAKFPLLSLSPLYPFL
jgi:hypothetical protein